MGLAAFLKIYPIKINRILAGPVCMRHNFSTRPEGKGKEKF